MKIEPVMYLLGSKKIIMAPSDANASKVRKQDKTYSVSIGLSAGLLEFENAAKSMHQNGIKCCCKNFFHMSQSEIEPFRIRINVLFGMLEGLQIQQSDD